MHKPFRFLALEAERFGSWFSKSDEELAKLGAKRMVADAKPGYPCRVSLKDAEPGETVLLVPYVHHDVDGPYRAGGAIFVREGAATATFAPGEVPEMLLGRLISLRAYDKCGMMTAAEVVKGTEVERTVSAMLADAAVDSVHVHNAKPGCYNCRVVRS